MDLKRSILSVVAGVALFAPAAAFADHDDGDSDNDYRRKYSDGYRQEDYRHDHSASCSHGAMPARPAYAGRGRYELRTVQSWVEGRWVRDFVPGRCVQGRHGRMRCRDGHYVDRWVPAHYENAQKWVWVPARRPGWRVSVRF